MPERAALIELLVDHLTRYPEDGLTVAQICELVGPHENCFERDCVPGHITASAWIVSMDGARCLLTHHRKLKRWLQLGGHADGDTDVRAVALREAREESGLQDFEVVGGVPIDVDVHTIPARADEPEHEHHDLRFLLRAQQPDDAIRISEESLDLRWFSWGELHGMIDEESMLRMMRRSYARLFPDQVVDGE